MHVSMHSTNLRSLVAVTRATDFSRDVFAALKDAALR